MKSKIIQIAVNPHTQEDYHTITVLCEEGTVWSRSDRKDDVWREWPLEQHVPGVITLPDIPGRVRQSFIDAMEKELSDNTDKGDWEKWSPSRVNLNGELLHHYNKLEGAILAQDPLAVREHAADLANLAMKADELFGNPPPYVMPDC